MDEYFGQLWSMAFSEQDPVGRAINFLILALFLLGCADVLRSLVRLAGERQLIAAARERLKKSAADCPAEPDEGKVLRFVGATADSLLGRRVRHVVRLRRAGLDHRDVLHQLSAEHVEGYGALARYIGMTLTLLGLLGTVFGMSLALFKIQGALVNVSDVAALNQLTLALGGTLRGMKTAFGCTMMGLLTAIVISFFNHVLRRQQAAVLNRLEDFVVYDLLPVLEEVAPGADEAARVFANVVMQAAAELGKVRGDIVTAASGYAQSSGAMREAAAALQSSVGAFGQSAGQVAGNQQGFTEALGETRRAVVKMTETLGKQFEDVRAFTASATKTFDARLASLEESAEAGRAMQRGVQELAEQFQTALQSYHALFKGVTGEMFAEHTRALKAMLDEVRGHLEKGALAPLSEARKDFEAALVKHMAKLEQMVGDHQQGLSELTAEQSAMLRTFSDMVVDLNMNMSGLFARLAYEGNGYGARPAAAG